MDTDLTRQNGSKNAAQVYERPQACNLCGGHSVEQVGSHDRRGNPLETVICTGCGLISHAHIPSDEELAAYYAQQYRRDYHGQAAPSAHRVVRAWKMGRRLYRRLRNQVRPGDRVFEIGAGLGCNLKPFQVAGHSASGIEPGEGFQAFARQMLHVDVAKATLEDLAPEPAYDFILLVHVIEHLPDPQAALRHICGLLRSGGRLYVECPNIGAPHAAPGKMFHYAHIFNFTHETLIALARAAGFRVQRKLSRPHGRNLMIVFEKARRPEHAIPEDGYRGTLARITRYDQWTYHLRPSYLLSRLGILLDLYGDRLLARRRLRGIVARCQRTGKPVQAPRRDAA